MIGIREIQLELDAAMPPEHFVAAAAGSKRNIMMTKQKLQTTLRNQHVFKRWRPRLLTKFQAATLGLQAFAKIK